MVAVVFFLLVVLSAVCVRSLRLRYQPIHSPTCKLHIGTTHKSNVALSVANENSDVIKIPNVWLQKLKRSVLPLLVSLSVAGSAIMPASARAKKEVATSSNVKQTIKKDTQKPNKNNKNTAEVNKKVVRVSLDVADDLELQQQKRAETLTKMGLAVAAVCAAYVVLPGGGRKTKFTDATTPTPEDKKDIQALKPKHKYDRITDTTAEDGENSIDDVEELYPMHSARRNVHTNAPAGSAAGSGQRIQQEPPSDRQSSRQRTQGAQGTRHTGGLQNASLCRPSGPDDLLIEGETSIDDALSAGKADKQRSGIDRSGSAAEGSSHTAPAAAESAGKGRGRKPTSSKASEVSETTTSADSRDVTPRTPPPPAVAVPAASEVPPFASIQPAPPSSKLSSPPPQAPTPTSAKKGPGGFLGRFFNKAGSSRPADIATALHAADPAVAHYRALVAENLLECMPLGALPDTALVSVSELLTAAGVGVQDEAGGQRQVLSLQQASTQAGLSDAAAAEAFADVTNAMLVSLIDAAAAVVDVKDAHSFDVSVERLDCVAEFMENVGVLYSEVFPAVVVDPIKYNGKVKGNKLEELYYRYCKASIDVKSQLSGMLGSTSSGSSSDDAGSSAEADAGAVTAARRAEWLGRIQFLFDLKDSKHQSIQQRVMKEVVLDMTQGGGGTGDFALMMESMLGGGSSSAVNKGGFGGVGGGGGGGSSPFPQDFDFGSFAEAMQKGGGELPKNIPGMPDFGKMSPEEMQEVTQQAQMQMKQMLRDGLLTKNDVLQFEQAMSTTVEEMLRAMGINGMNKQQILAHAGPDAADLVDMLQQLAAIKKR